MGNETIDKEMKNLQSLMVNIVDENVKMKGKIEEMNQNILKLNEQNLKQSQELEKQNQKMEKQSQKMEKQSQEMEKKNQKMEKQIKELKESVEILTDECQDMKEILGNIQYRDLSKNFLKYFKTFLNEEDWKRIKKNKYKRGEIIAQRIEKFYPKADKQKMSIVRELIKNSSNLIEEGNFLAHSVTLDKYEDEINAYKKKKNIKNLTSPIAFC